MTTRSCAANIDGDAAISCYFSSGKHAKSFKSAFPPNARRQAYTISPRTKRGRAKAWSAEAMWQRPRFQEPGTEVEQRWTQQQRLDARDDAGHRVILAQIEQRVLIDAVEPDATAGITIAHAHRNQPNRHTAAMSQEEVPGDDVARQHRRTRDQAVIAAIFASDREVGTWKGELLSA